MLERVDGRWQTAFRFTDDELARMSLRAANCSGDGAARLFGTSAVTQPDSPAAPQTVVVAMGDQGALRLNPESGAWDRVAVGALGPISTSGP
ncbi:MAG: hypothetical protein OEV40_24785, partial [Acidimicrobiia bacterium]|nr:hypothetical protein [Acidimicrobiia bacterium]